jgi:hypothetical protein
MPDVRTARGCLHPPENVGLAPTGLAVIPLPDEPALGREPTVRRDR